MASKEYKNRQADQTKKNLNLSKAQIEEIKKEITEQVTSRLTVVQSETYSGAYPHPKHIEQYEKHFPGFLKKFTSLAETE